MHATTRHRITAAAAGLLAALTASCASPERSVEASAAAPTVAGPRRPDSLLMTVPPPVAVAAAPALSPVSVAASPPAAAPARFVQPAPAPVVTVAKAAPRASAPPAPVPLAPPPAVTTAPPSHAVVATAPAAAPLARPSRAAAAPAGLDEHYRRRLAEQGRAVRDAPQPATVEAVVVPQWEPRPVEADRRRRVERTSAGGFGVLEDHYRRRLAQQWDGGWTGDSVAGAPPATRAD